MKNMHAYLILAHNEFKILQALIDCLDDEQHVLFVHIDKKVKHLPALISKKSKLIILEDRADIRWGHVSQIEGHYKLYEAAQKTGSYQFYHLISGAHLPLYSCSYLQEYFNRRQGLELFSPLTWYPKEVADKIQSYNLFMRWFSHPNEKFARIAQKCWRLVLIMQRIFKIGRRKNEDFIKASNWSTLSEGAVQYLIDRKRDVLKSYRYSMCGDEFFAPSELSKAGHVFELVFDDRLLKHEIGKANARVFTGSDYEDLTTSNRLFARKFSEKDMELVDKIIQRRSER